MDCHLTYKEQISSIVKSCNFKLKQIARNRKFLNENDCKKLVTALVLSKLNFACTVYHQLPEYQIKRLQKVQNLAARIITKTNRHCQITPILKDLKWLRIKEFIKYRYLTIVYQSLQNESPD